MEAVARQLVRVRRVARGLLIVQRLAQFVAGALAVALALGGLDFLLRLPTWGRVFIVIIAAVAGGIWLGTQLSRALRFRPSLSDLALRAERLFPALRGALASAVEFSLSPEAYASPSTTAALSSASVTRTEGWLSQVELSRLIDLTPTWRVLAVLAVSLLGFVGVVLATPSGAQTAAARWLTPWRGVEWPLRVQVANQTEVAVWPIDTPLRLRSEVERGYSEGMRVWVTYRLLEASSTDAADPGQAGPREHLLMSEQAGEASGTFERLIDLSDHLLGAGTAVHRGTIEYTLTAGDHTTRPRQIRLVSRPAVTSVVADIRPPAYAEGLIGEQRHTLHRQSGQVATATALAGSTVTLDVTFNKPVVMDDDVSTALAALLPGVTDADGFRHRTSSGDAGVRSHGVTVPFRLNADVETPIHLVDEHGLASRSERRYRIEAVTDQSPAASLVEPVSDEAVLPSARVRVEGMAQDDVALERLHIEARVVRQADASDPDEPTTMELVSQSGRQPQLNAHHELDLSELELQSGDAVVLTAVARDIYDLNGQRHEPVRSSERRLRIIDEPTFIGQLRGELSAVRQQALRMDDRQRQLVEDRPDLAETRRQQQRLSDRMEGQETLVQRLERRMQRNRLEEPALGEMMTRSRELLEQARQASEVAGQQLEQAERAEGEAAAEAHREQAAEHQAEVREALQTLAELLDQSRDALTLTLQLRQLLTEQQTLEAETRRLLPQTVGEDVANLPDELREQLRELAEQQRETAERADEMVRQMRSTATALNRDDASDRDRVSGELLGEAASMAEQAGLSEQMEQAGESVDENQLSQAGTQQHESMELMEQMLSRLGRQQERMQAMLQRRLDELAQAIQRLIEQQTNQNERLERAEQLAALEPGQAGVRRNVMAVSDQAGRSPETQPIAATLDQAVTAQGQAIVSMRAERRPPTQVAQQEAIEHLQAALEAVREQQQQAMQEQLEQQRAELRERYEQLAEQQAALREQAAEAAEVADRDRRQRARLIELGHEQADVRIAIDELGDETDEVMMFELLHRRMDRSLDGVVRNLRRASVDESLLWEQSEVERMLRMLAAALDDDGQPSEFAGQQGGGDGGGGGGQMPPLVPPAAELKVLRDMQRNLYERTRAVNEEGQQAGLEGLEDRLRSLGSEQRELSAVGERLIEQLRQMQSGGE